MKKYSLIGLLLLFLASGANATIYQGHGVTIEGALKNETGVYLDSLGKFIKIMNVIDLKGQYQPAEYLSLFVHVYKFWDHAYNVEDDYQSARYQMYTNRKTWTGISWVRELYLDYFSDYIDVRLGKQIVTWGTADGIRILDEYVNPLDWREFSLKAWNEIKVPLWMLKVELVPTVNGSLQFLFIPDFEPDYWPAVNSPYAIGTSKLGAELLNGLKRAGFSVSQVDDRPAETFENAKFGVRWRDVLGNFEYTINYIYSWATKSPEKVTIRDVTTLTAISKTQYYRVNVWGFSFSKTFVSGFLQGLTLRGEFTYTKDEPRCYKGNDGRLYWKKTDLFKYAIGLDKYIITNWFTSFQFIQLIRSKKDVEGQPFVWCSAGPMDKVETILTLKVSTDFFHERLKPGVLIIYGDDNDWRISPEAFFEISDHITTKLGMHIFVGKESGIHGQFNDKNELFLEVKYSF